MARRLPNGRASATSNPPQNSKPPKPSGIDGHGPHALVPPRASPVSCWLRRDRLHSNAWHKVLRCPLPIADATAATPLLSDPSPLACGARPPSGYAPRSGRGEPFRCEACIIGAVL